MVLFYTCMVRSGGVFNCRLWNKNTIDWVFRSWIYKGLLFGSLESHGVLIRLKVQPIFHVVSITLKVFLMNYWQLFSVAIPCWHLWFEWHFFLTALEFAGVNESFHYLDFIADFAFAVTSMAPPWQHGNPWRFGDQQLVDLDGVNSNQRWNHY